MPGSVALSGDAQFLVVARRDCNVNGGVEVYNRSEVTGIFSLLQLLEPTDATGGDWFGTSAAVSRDGSTVVVGAANHAVAQQAQAGAIYVFSWSSSGTAYVQTRKVTRREPVAMTSFGDEVTLAADGVSVVAGSLGNYVALFRL